MVTLLLLGCLERTTGESKPLDPRFLRGDPGGGTAGGVAHSAVEHNPDAAPPGPFDDLEGPRVLISGLISSPTAARVELDVRALDASVEGGVKQLGKVFLDGVGPWSLEVPKGYGTLFIDAYQDLAGDGPGDDDPFAGHRVEVGEVAVPNVDFALEVGGRQKSIAALAPGNDAFAGVEGPRVKLSGLIVSPESARVELDLRAPDASAEGGVKQLGKVFLEGVGPWSLEVPKGYGTLIVDAYQDLAGDGPGDDDPFAGRRIEVGAAPLSDLNFELVVGGRQAAIAAMAPSVSPFPDHTGPWTTLRGTVRSKAQGPVALDLRLPDPSSQTGDRYLGKVQLGASGPFELPVPRGLGKLTIEAFQDLKGDGPSPDDPYARVQVAVGEQSSLDLAFDLVAGAYTGGGSPAGAPGAQPGGGPAGGLNPGAAPMFKDLGERPVTISGTLTLVGSSAPIVDLDVFAADPVAPGGRRFLGKLKVAPGPFSFQAPSGYGALELEAFVDKDTDGPSPSDPFGACTANPVRVGSSDVSGLVIEVRPRGDAAAP